MGEGREMIGNRTLGGRKSGSGRLGSWRRALLASSAVLSLVQNAAWATCSDATTFPAGGFVIGSTQVPTAANWSQNVFTAAAGSVFIPDVSVNEANDPTKPLTGGGHNWVFDQGSTLCKQIDAGSAGAPATAWTTSPRFSAGCILLPIFNANGIITDIGDIAVQGGAITPTCNPAILASAGNTYFNQLGCSISHGVARDAQHATTYLFVLNDKGSLIVVGLDNVVNPQVGGDAGKVAGSSFGSFFCHPLWTKAHQRRDKPRRAIRHGHVEQEAADCVRMFEPVGRSGRSDEADQSQLRHSRFEYRAVHAGRQ
jgi:hypothetical protein